MNIETVRRDPKREALWRERIAAIEASGKTDSQWCRENNVCRRSIWAWRKRLSEQDCTDAFHTQETMRTEKKTEENELVDITAMYEPARENDLVFTSRPALTIRTGRYHIDVYDDTSASVLRNVLEVLHHV